MAALPRRARAAGPDRLRHGRLERLAFDPVAQLGPATGRDRARRTTLVERHAAPAGEVEQLLALLALARGAHEEPAEQAQGHDRALDHHDRAAGDLVGE